jgi:hypothetical protein
MEERLRAARAYARPFDKVGPMVEPRPSADRIWLRMEMESQ